VGIFVLAAVLTPPDVVSQLMLAIPMCVLYELGIHAARWLQPRDRERDVPPKGAS
ncbi:twin-arginine translocase subunit TatC, partial [Thermomonas sp.]